MELNLPCQLFLDIFPALGMCFCFPRFLFPPHLLCLTINKRIWRIEGNFYKWSLVSWLKWNGSLYLPYLRHLTDNNTFILHEYFIVLLLNILHFFSASLLVLFPPLHRLPGLTVFFHGQHSSKGLKGDDLFVTRFCFQRCATKEYEHFRECIRFRDICLCL